MTSATWCADVSGGNPISIAMGLAAKTVLGYPIGSRGPQGEASG